MNIRLLRVLLMGLILPFAGTAHAQQPRTTGQAAVPKTAAPRFNCTPTAEKLHVEAARLRAQFADGNDFLRALDQSFGFDTVFLSTHPAMSVHSSDELSIFAVSPYVGYRVSLLEALRKRDPVDNLPVPAAFVVVVSPSRINAPDIVKIIVERDGKEIEPTINELRPTPLTTRLGARAVLHAGQALFPCSAFAPGAVVKVIAIPETGGNIETTIPEGELAGFSPQNSR